MFDHRIDGSYYSYQAPDTTRMIGRIPAGTYHANAERPTLVLTPMTPSSEPVYFLDTPEMRMVRREIEAFFDPDITQRLARAGLKHRRGIILHGPPGTGKTSLMRQLMPFVIEQDAVIIVDCNADHLERRIIPAVRASDPDRPIVMYFDEFDKNASHSRAELLQLLDGLTSPDHLLTIGSTNDLTAVPTQLRNRPSRFGLILEIDRLPDGVHERLAAQKYPTLSKADRQYAVQLTQHLPVDYLEEACKLFLMGYDPDEIRDRVQRIAPAGSGSRRR
jgi:hypothetical protein